ncbi:ensconsin-like isoform X6 [Lethenteron reissneri]|uniref:ensconsin-like isoform X6 n=1 Tax=Lethenteron reissneri TaxID=7753 RepID=UPI002AB5F727|nr:ensconsin-like isoform X6 [Lethenteron reissneri]
METISVLEGANGKMEDKLRQAKERREEQEKLLAARERAWQEREERARLHQEQQRDERRRRVEQQRERDEKRRAAADEKRRHLTTVEQVQPIIQRSLERRGSLDTRRKRWSWGGSSSVVATPNSPVQEGLASGGRVGSSGGPVIPPNRPLRSRSGDRLSKDSSDNGSSQDLETSSRSQETLPAMRREAAHSKRSPSPATEANDKTPTSPAGGMARLPSPAKSSPARRRRTSPGNATPQSPSRHRPPSPSNPRQARRSGERTKERATTPGDVKSPGTPEKKLPRGAKPKDKEASEAPAEQANAGDSRAGTSNAEEATRLLGEKRRQAREQREREEVERRVREENERLMREELARRKAEERLRRQEEARRAEEQRARDAAEREARAVVERLQHERDEHNKLVDLQRQREEAEARALEEAERQRQEREKVFQREEQERQERKKRLEQIMSRTRKPYKADVGKLCFLSLQSVLEPIVAVEESQNKGLDFISEDGSEQTEDFAAEEDKEEEEEALLGGSPDGCESGGGDDALGSALAADDGSLAEKEGNAPGKVPGHILSAVAEAFDEVQSMDVSPVSKDDGLSGPDFSPLYEPGPALTGVPGCDEDDLLSSRGDGDGAEDQDDAGDGGDDGGGSPLGRRRRPPPASLAADFGPPAAHRADDMSNSNVVPASVIVSAVSSSDICPSIPSVGNGSLLEL